MSENTCAGPECDRKVRANGLCNAHQVQAYRNGRDSLIPLGSYKRPAKEGCDFPECARKHYALGLCKRHYLNKRAGLELKPIKARKKETGDE